MKKLIIPKQTVAKEDINEDLTGTPPADLQTTPVGSEDGVNQEEFDPELLAAVEPEAEGVIDIDPNSAEVALEEMQQEISNELSENDKVADIAENLNDIADTVEASPASDLSDTEKQLIASSANMAVSGTDDDAAEIAPSLESFKDKALVIAELRKKHQIATEGILDSVKNIFVKFGEFVKSLFSFVGKIEYRLKGLKKKLADLKSGEKVELKTTFKKTRFLLKDAVNPVKDFDDYLQTLKNTVTFFDSFAVLAAKSVGDFAGSVSEYWTTAPGTDKTFAAAAGLYSAYIKDFVQGTKSLPGMKKQNEVGVKPYDVFESEPMLGGTSVTVQVYKNIAKIDKENTSEMKNTISNSFVKINPKGKEVKIDDSTNFAKKIVFSATISKLEEVLKLVEKSLKTFKVFLDKSYKSFKLQAITEGPKWEALGSLFGLHNLIVLRGINNALMFVSYAKTYSKILCFSPLDIVDNLLIYGEQ